MSVLVDVDDLSSVLAQDPWGLYARTHAEDLVLHDRKTGRVFVGRHAQVHHVLTSVAYTTTPFTERAEPVLGARVLAQMSGAEHAFKRRAVLSQLTGRMFRERYREGLDALVNRLLDGLREQRSFDLMRDFGGEYSILATLLVLGLPTEHHRQVAQWQAGVTRFITALEMTDEERSHGARCSRALIAYLTPIVERCVQQADGGFIANICSAGDGSTDACMSIPEGVALVMNLLLAATEPADKTLGYLFHHLLCRRERLEAVIDDPALLGPAIEETLRLTPPVHLIPRCLEGDDVLGGVPLRSGTMIFCMVGAANRDPEAFESPDAFRLDRKQESGAGGRGVYGRHLAFGMGPHVCVGAAFARMQLECAAQLLIARFPRMRLSQPGVLSEHGIYTRGPVAVHVDVGSDPLRERVGGACLEPA